MADVTFRGSSADLRRAIHQLPAILAGRAPDPLGLAKGLQVRVGNAVLSQVQQAFAVKARGGTGSDGVKWKPLAPSTVARRRPGPADRTAVAAARKAAKAAGRRFNASALLAARPVEILVDTGKLFRSFAAGVADRPSGAESQVFRVTPGLIVVGSTEKPWHHRGNPPKLPSRPYWPLDGKLPRPWWEAARAAGTSGLARAVQLLAESGAKL